MKTQFVVCLLIATFQPGCSQNKHGQHLSVPQQSVEGELKRLQGTWQLVSSRAYGADLPSDVIQDCEITFSANKKIVRVGGQVIFDSVIVEIDPTAVPKQIDQKQTDDRTVGIRGIYRLNADTLTMCTAAAGERRPAKFESPRGSNLTLQVFRRKKYKKSK